MKRAITPLLYAALLRSKFVCVVWGGGGGGGGGGGWGGGGWGGVKDSHALCAFVMAGAK